MSKEYPENERPFVEENPPKRRKDDYISHQVLITMVKSFEKTLNLLKYTIIALFVAMILLYNIFTGDTTREDYQIRLLNDLLIKIEDFQNQTPRDSSGTLERIINLSYNTKQCGACHNENNEIKLFASWTFIDFKNYMRGTKRIPQNNIMPNYTQSDLPDLEIEKIFEILKGSR